MPDDRSDSDAGAQKGSGRKARPPVIELKATDVTPEQPASAGTEESAAPKQEPPKAEAPPRAPDSSSPPPGDKRNPVLFAVTAGMIGLLTGALVLALVVLFARDGVKRLMAKATETVSGAPAMSEFSSMRARSEQLAKNQSEIQKRLTAIETQAKTFDPAPLNARLDSLESSLKDLRSFAEQAQTAGSLTSEALVERMNALDAQIKKMLPRPAAANAAEVVALGSLQDAIVKGRPYAKELHIVRSMLGDAGAPLQPLESSASSGIPTIAQLRKNFSELVPKLLREPEEKGGYFSKLLNRIVEVRPVGEAAGTSVGAVVARIETRLARGDLSAALDQAAQFPPSAKATAADWVAAATRRRDADTAVKKLLDSELDKSAAGPPK